MNVLILGAGALGSLFGARLQAGGYPVVLFSIDRAHMEAIRREGLRLEELDGRVQRVDIPAVSEPSKIPFVPDLVLVLVKAQATQSALDSVTHLCSASTLFLTLQNGIGNIERMAEAVDAKRILAGITAQGATLVAPGRIRHGGNGPTSIGEVSQKPGRRVQDIVEAFTHSGLKAHATAHTLRVIWHKLLINVGINALTGLAGVANGWIAANGSARELAVAAVREGLAVARAQGIDLEDSLLDDVIEVASSTAANTSSMLQDVLQRRPTEIEAINGAVVSYARASGLEAPVNWTLTQLVRTLQASYLQPEGSAYRRPA